MSATNYGPNNPLAVKVWEKKLFHEALKQTIMAKFIGDNKNAMIYKQTNLEKGPGDRITYGLRMQLNNAGVAGDATLEGQEEALITYSDNIFIDQLRNAVLSEGKMSEQRIPFSIRNEALMGLQDWLSGRIDLAAINQLAGNTGVTDTRYTGSNSTTAPDVNHHIFAGGHTTEASVASAGASNSFKLTFIDQCVEQAKVLSPTIRPIMVGGAPKYVMILHPYQVFSLRTNTATGQWLDIQKAAMTGGQISNNPIYTGALGEYNGVVIHEDERVPETTTNVRRAIFAGAQAGCIAFGQASGGQSAIWSEELFDYGNKLGISGGLVWGVKKSVFNSSDFGTIVVSTYAVSHKDVAV